METTAITIEPLNKATENVFKKLPFAKNDRMRISLDAEAKRFILELYSIGRHGNEYSPSGVARSFLRRIPERRELSPYPCKYVAAGTDFTALIINALWPAECLLFTEEAKLLYDFLLTRFTKQTFNSRIKADYKINGIIPDMPKDWIDRLDRPLMNFQKVALLTSLYEDANLWMEQGTGKTPIIISRICYEAMKLYKKEKRMYRALIVVPKNMRTNWRNKFMDFATRPGKITILKGSQLTRLKLMVECFKQDDESEYTVLICSYEAVVRSWEAMRLVEWDGGFLDEAHMIKGYSTKRWHKIRELREKCNGKSGLTGTPFANNLFDVYTQLEWLGEGLSGFSNFKSFRAYYGRFSKNNNQQYSVLTGYKNLPVLQERIARLCFMITRDEAMPYLPKKTYDVYEVEMTKTQREYYVKLQKQLAIEIKNELNKEKNKQLTATNILTKLLRLSQITAGYVKWDSQFDDEGNLLNEDSQFESINPNPKIEAIVEILKTKKPKEKTIIWTNWVPVIKMLDERLTKENIKHAIYYGGTKDADREEAERSYNQDPEMKVFIGNPAAGGQGLDLWGHVPEWDDTEKDFGCNTTQEIYFSQNWSMIHRSQSEDRAVRRGTRVSVQITDLIVPGTIDEEIAIRVLNKKIVANKLQDVKDIMTKVLSNLPDIGEDNE